MRYPRKSLFNFSKIFFCAGLFCGFFMPSVIAEDFSQYGERDIFETFGDEKSKDSAIPETPMQLINIMQKFSSMEDATTPSDALDQALELYDENSFEDIYKSK